ncbi:MAG: hypothetical protein CMO55_15110 [Verrucomicrobiales bacterium]|nr:hypothetical protein [Verrucomicrobiales bacterium]
MANGENKTVSGFERFVFGLTRAFALVGAAVLVILIAVIAVKLFSPVEGSEVSYSDVVESLNNSEEIPDAGESGSDSWGAIEAEVPKNLQVLFEGENKNVLVGWIDQYSKSQQEDFLQNMSVIAEQAERNGKDPIDAINAYAPLKFAKMSSDEFGEYKALATRAGYTAAIFGLFLILSILSLTLVMLAIERNTRAA